MRNDLNCEQELVKINGKLFPCGTSVAMNFIGGKWKMVIIYHLKDGKLRYNELRKVMPVITERTLSLQLKQLEGDGIVSRKVYTQKPPLKVEYALTDFGKTLLPVVDAVGTWGDGVVKTQGEVVRVKV